MHDLFYFFLSFVFHLKSRGLFGTLLPIVSVLMGKQKEQTKGMEMEPHTSMLQAKSIL